MVGCDSAKKPLSCEELSIGPSPISTLMSERPFLDICIGDAEAHVLLSEEYQQTVELLKKHAKVYGMPEIPEELSEEQQDILKDLTPTSLRFNRPPSLTVGRLVFTLDPSPGLAKTRSNFLSLCKGDKGMCKNAPTKPLHYRNVPIHRLVKGFVVQGGDVTRWDGSGGESIYNGKSFNDEKDGLKKKLKLGSLAMANSGKNSNTSQFFIVLTSEESKLVKLYGKYVVFGEIETGAGDGLSVLEKINAIAADIGEIPTEKIWIGDCGVLQ